MLQTGWVQLFNVPDMAKNSDAVALIGELAGKVIALDEVSLIKEGPVRVKLRARDVTNLRGFVEIFVEGVGYEIKFVTETTKKIQPASRNPPPPPKKPDNEDFSDDDDADDLDEYEQELRCQLSDPTNKSSAEKQKSGQTPIPRQRTGGLELVKDVPLESEPGSTLKGTNALEIQPIAMYNPYTETLTINSESNAIPPQQPARSVRAEASHKEAETKWPSPPTGCILVHTEGGGYKFLEKDKWPTLTFQEDELGERVENKQGSINDPELLSQGSIGNGEVVETEGSQHICSDGDAEISVLVIDEDEEKWEVGSGSISKEDSGQEEVSARSSHQAQLQEPG
ncbi:hypothetical protein C2845_PM15G01420 [Panicum miliaceum]|uniref:DUF4283 domain-containing protein n=1 Tax=Panicum miliaceum TaxID=4540 RepID=A0A3L6Q9P1_PANMI|nr:hypothetical protein C2845_PM15G01420 [Panicum miliaceum]